ncbi:MAG: penicillin acylase family protein [Gemmatimonadota bacterium]
MRSGAFTAGRRRYRSARSFFAGSPGTPWGGLTLILLLFSGLLPSAAVSGPLEAQERLSLPGLDHPVEILVDRWGISHIYAETEHDLFFAQGWNAARDRLFQLEIWRRQATGTVAEILGPRELARDVGARLFRFRGDLEQELRHYHPRGVEIIQAFVDGINAYVAAALEDPDLLSVEFRMLGIQPGYWTPEVVISRHQGLLSNVRSELGYGRAVAVAGPEAVKDVAAFQPRDPELALDPALDKDHLLEHDVLALYSAFRGSIRFQPEDVLPEFREEAGTEVGELPRGSPDSPGWVDSGRGPAVSFRDIGSNNWIVSGRRSASGFPIMANDPHRAQAAPSLRYWVHLVGPGWNVIGGGEPVLPGVSIGHNEHGAWGLTVFATDTEDLYVYELSSRDADLYRYRGSWERMTVISDTIPVRGRDPEVVEHRYTRHGPVVYRDEEAGIAYAVRAAWMEVGGAPYLASLRMDQATSWEEFRDACTYSNIPGENMIWGDRTGTTGWQAVGIAPIRRNWSGLVPVPGDGRYEWDGYLPIQAKPHLVNPPEGYFATANNYLVPPDYPFPDAVGFEWSDPYRWLRAVEVLAGGRRFTLQDMMALQTDELSIPARTLVPLLAELSAGSPAVESARLRLVGWDHVLDRGSVAAGIYVAWEGHLRSRVRSLMMPEALRPHLGSVSMRQMLEWILLPDGNFGDDPVAGRDAFLLSALDAAVEELSERFGRDQEAWVYGQEAYKHIRLRHPLSRAVSAEWRDRLEVGPAPRGGNSYTLNQTGGGDNQTSGASFRIIVDTEDWDRTVGMNNPGQGGHPDHPHYEDLFRLWARDGFHPVFYTREKVESVTGERIRLEPKR